MSSKPAKSEKQATLPKGAARQRLIRALAEVIAERQQNAAALERLRDLHR